MATALNVFVNACTAGEYATGIPTYAYEISGALAGLDDVRVLLATTSDVPQGAEHVVPPKNHRQLWTQFAVPRLRKRLGADVYFGTEYSSPVFTRAPRVVFVHDLAHRFMPRLYTRRGLLHVRMLFETLRRADRLIAPTTSVAGDIVQ